MSLMSVRLFYQYVFCARWTHLLYLVDGDEMNPVLYLIIRL